MNVNQCLLVLISAAGLIQGCKECQHGGKGDNLTCGLISGLYTKPHLPPGLTYITKIPVGACSLNISLLRPHNNHLVIKLRDGQFAINEPGIGDTSSGEYEVAGTKLIYTRGDGVNVADRVTAEGPLGDTIHLALLVADINHGVEYKFYAPMKRRQSGRRHGRGHRKHGVGGHSGGYKWSMKQLDQCSRSCGGGTQTLVAQCVIKGVARVVPDTKCDVNSRPMPRSVPCNRKPCPADWVTGEWSTCSTTCGPGVQERRVTCRQELAGGVSVPVFSQLCPGDGNHSLVTRRNCIVKDCANSAIGTTDASDKSVKAPSQTDASTYRTILPKEDNSRQIRGKVDDTRSQAGYLATTNAGKYMATQPQQSPASAHSASERVFPYSMSSPNVVTDWVAQVWGPCSVSCGHGVRERQVHCADVTRGGLLPDARCQHLNRPQSEEFCEAGPCVKDTWLVGGWGLCSATCGQGKIHRKVTCLGTCNEDTEPHSVEECHAPEPCTQEWLTGRWTVCSHSCGQGVQSRSVECVVNGPNGKLVTNDQGCSDKRKPKTQRRCHIQRCPAEWFTTEWSKCSEQCGVRGVRTREVVCLKDFNISDTCKDAPETTEECVVHNCEAKPLEKDEDDEDDYIYELEPEDYNEIDDIDVTTKAAPEKHYPSNRSFKTEVKRGNRVIKSNNVVPEKHSKDKSKLEEGCKDKFKNCNVVVQSRLCRYTFYQSNCCNSCARLSRS